MRCVVITGAGGVLGAAAAIRLLRRGCPVLLSDLNPDSLARAAQSALTAATGGEHLLATEVADLSVVGSASQLVHHATERFGSVRGCINAAGVERPVVASVDIDMAAMRAAYEVNVFGLVEMCIATVRHLLDTGESGRIVNVASGAALSGAAYLMTYNSSKHAVLGATRSLAREYAAHGIALNALCPGFIESRMVSSILEAVGSIQGQPVEATGQIPAGRFADPDEIAAVLEFLALDAPLYMTGSAVVVDGGLYA